MKKSKNKIICFDLDDVICKTKAKKYFLAKPYPKVIKKINNLYSKVIILKFLQQDLWDVIMKIQLKQRNKDIKKH